MFLLLVFLVLLMGAAIGWSIGANDAANSLGTAVGSKALNLKQAIILIAVFGLLGALLQGSYVTKTIGKGIVPIDQLDKTLALYLAVVATFSACAWVVLATYWKMPISTSHSIVGAICGVGLVRGTRFKHAYYERYSLMLAGNTVYFRGYEFFNFKSDYDIYKELARLNQ